jgi:hypothetical protein
MCSSHGLWLGWATYSACRMRLSQPRQRLLNHDMTQTLPVISPQVFGVTVLRTLVSQNSIMHILAQTPSRTFRKPVAAFCTTWSLVFVPLRPLHPSLLVDFHLRNLLQNSQCKTHIFHQIPLTRSDNPWINLQKRAPLTALMLVCANPCHRVFTSTKGSQVRQRQDTNVATLREGVDRPWRWSVPSQSSSSPSTHHCVPGPVIQRLHA